MIADISSLSWADKFALIEHFKPSEDQIRSTFNLDDSDLRAAQAMYAAGLVKASTNLNVKQFSGVFEHAPIHTPQKPSNRKQVVFGDTIPQAKHHKKRGRKGDKISQALMAIPLTPVSIQTYAEQQGVSVAVLKQHKRFSASLSQADLTAIGTIRVRVDKETRELMIWRELAA